MTQLFSALYELAIHFGALAATGAAVWLMAKGIWAGLDWLAKEPDQWEGLK